MSVITLSLMHPTKRERIQSWTFEPEQNSVITVGRARDNDVVVHSSVVSRKHLELWQNETEWEIINFGSNGTYVNNQAIAQEPVLDGMIVRLGSSGPKMEIRLAVLDSNAKIRKAGGGGKPGTGTGTLDPSKDRQTFLTGGQKTQVEEEDAPATQVEIR
ncbi:MAG: FHA domain-containing protein [Hormoscilla sp.]